MSFVSGGWYSSCSDTRSLFTWQSLYVDKHSYTWIYKTWNGKKRQTSNFLYSKKYFSIIKITYMLSKPCRQIHVIDTCILNIQNPLMNLEKLNTFSYPWYHISNNPRFHPTSHGPSIFDDSQKPSQYGFPFFLFTKGRGSWSKNCDFP